MTNDTCDFVQRVPDVTDEVFRFGTQSPASILLDAVDQLDKQSPKADDNIQLIRPQLAEAVDACVKASGHEFGIQWQRQLLKAASFGKSVLDIYNSDDFVDMCTTLRVLNAVREYKIGMPISYGQYLRLTPTALIERLINRSEYLLALRIADYLRLPTDRIYVHWATQKVRLSAGTEIEITKAIVDKLGGKRGISFEEIARAAYDEGRGHLATSLLNHEPRAGKQVPLLLSMEEDEIALDKAVESFDPDLIFYVLLRLKRKLPLATFFRTISSRPLATALVEASAQKDDTELLKDLYYQDDRRLDGSLIFVRDAFKQTNTKASIDKLSLAAKLLTDSKEYMLEQKSLVEAQTLLKIQESLEKDLDSTYVGLSLTATFYTLIRNGYSAKTKRLVSQFSIPEKTQWYTKLRALIDARSFTELEDWARVKKSPIGWEPFFDSVLAAGNQKLAGSFVSKIGGNAEWRQRVDMWVRCGMVGRAAEEAGRYKDLEVLKELREKAKGAEAVEVERLINGLMKR